MKSRIHITRWRSGETWIEARERERRSDERWSMALIVGGACVLLALLWGGFWMVFGS